MATVESASLPEAAVQMIAAIGSVVGEEGAIYCSAPVTSGRQALAWASGHVADDWHVDDATPDELMEHERSVISANRIRASIVVQALRGRNSVPVIDPSALDARMNWKQDDWL